MTKATASTFLVATLVLTSGVCLSDAFSTACLTNEGRATTSSALSYAPKDSLPGDINPKRRRGRPRKSTTATTATSTGAPASKKKTTATARKTKKSSRSTQSTTSADGSTPILRKMLDHDLLTKDEEKHLGTQIRRAAQIQAAMALWIEENRDRILQQQEYQRLESLDFEDQYEEDVYDSTESPLYGSATSQAIERHFIEEAQDDIFLYPYETANLEEEDVLNEDDGLHGMSVFEPQMQRLQPSVPENWMDEILLQTNDQDLTMSMSSFLTDDDVRRVLDLPGGRSQLREILLEGALAREKLIRSNVRLVHSIATKWIGDMPKQQQGNSLVRVYSGATSITGRPTLDEALQEGILGLAEAAERFDPDRGFRFSTYATVWVTNSVRRLFQMESTSGMRLPIPHYDTKRKYVTRVRYYLDTEGHVPSMDVLAKDLGITVKRLVLALQLTQPLASLDSPIGGANQGSSGAGKAGGVDATDDGYTLASLLESDEPQPEDHVERSLLRQCLENAMATELSPNERDVIRLRLGLDDGVPQTAKEVAEVLGGRVSQAGIRAIEQRAFNKLRSPFGVHTQQLMSYLDFAGIDGNNQLRR